MSNPSRFDIKNFVQSGKPLIQLLSSTAGIFINECLQPEFNQMQIEIRTTECKDEFLPDTKCVLLLGQTALIDWCGSQIEGNTLNEMRGSVLEVMGIPAIATFLPQDAIEKGSVNHEKKFNELASDYTTDNEVSGDSEEEGNVKAFSPTRRSNYSFWIRADIQKIKAILQNSNYKSASPWCSLLYQPRGLEDIQTRRLAGTEETSLRESGIILPNNGIRLRPDYKIYPRADEVMATLLSTKGGTIYFDMETDYEEQNLLCFSFSFDSKCIYCVPVLDNNYRPAYTSLHFIMRALAIAIRDNTIVAHNGGGFDFFVLGYKYHIPVYSCYDTMIATHRCFPSIEKSLGHCTSLWTWEKFHKDMDSEGYFTREHMMNKLKYCGKDVYTMVLIKEAIDQYAKIIPGLVDSIKCANDSIVPYLLMSLQGIQYDEETRSKIVKENDRLMMQYIRMMNLLIGEQGLAEIKSYIKGFKGTFVGSSKQATTYFHTLLGYSILWRSPTTGEPSLGKKWMYQLAMKYPENPMIPLILVYRKVSKETGSLKFIPWKDDNNEVYRLPVEQGNLL